MLKQHIEVFAPAKVNLYLGISPLGTGGENIPDGYHAAKTIMHTVDLADVLVLELYGEEMSVPADASMPFELICEPPVDFPPEDNLVTHVARALARELNRPLTEFGERLTVRVTKNIPAKAGMGGGSSDAAAMIRALCMLWNVDPRAPECLAAARSIGADVPFFLYRKCVLMGGRGDEFVETYPPLDVPVVIVKRPETSVATADCYREFDASSPTAPDPQLLADMCALLEDESVTGVDKAARVSELLFNNLEGPARKLSPDIDHYLGWVSQQEGALGTLLSGSGAAVFAICESDEAAERIAKVAREQGFWSHAGRLK